MKRKRERTMRVWVTASGLGSANLIPLFGGNWKLLELVKRPFARRLFGRLPRHGSAECFVYDLTARRVKRWRRNETL